MIWVSIALCVSTGVLLFDQLKNNWYNATWSRFEWINPLMTIIAFWMSALNVMGWGLLK